MSTVTSRHGRKSSGAADLGNGLLRGACQSFGRSSRVSSDLESTTLYSIRQVAQNTSMKYIEKGLILEARGGWTCHEPGLVLLGTSAKHGCLHPRLQ